MGYIAASKQGIDKAKTALACKPKGSRSREKIAEVTKIDGRTIKKFFDGEAIQEGKFILICNFLELKWQEIRERSWESIPDAALSDFQEQFQSIIDYRLRRFVGREYIYDSDDGLNTFTKNLMNSGKGGYFIVVGDPGEGKSSILANYVRNINDNCLYYINNTGAGYTAAAFQENICQQMTAYLEATGESVPLSTVRTDGNFLIQLLQLASKQLAAEQRSLVIAVDALDEVDLSQQGKGNILYLPSDVPPNICFFLARRRIADEELRQRNVQMRFKNQFIYDLREHTAESRRDISTYINKCLFIEEDDPQYGEFMGFSQKLLGWIANCSIDVCEFRDTLLENSKENFMYISLLVDAIFDGAYDDRAVAELPKSLEEYYDHHWQAMNVTQEKARIVYALCKLSKLNEPTSRKALAEICRQSQYAVNEVLDSWDQFLHCDESNSLFPPLYQFYHQTYRDYLDSRHVVQIIGQEMEEFYDEMADGLSDGFTFS